MEFDPRMLAPLTAIAIGVVSIFYFYVEGRKLDRQNEEDARRRTPVYGSGND